MATSFNGKNQQQKLSVCFLLIIFIFVSIGFFTLKGLQNIGELTRRIYEHPLVVSNASLEAALNVTKMHRSMKDVVLANSPDEKDIALQSVNENEKIVYQKLDIIQDKILGQEGATLQIQTRQLFDNWKPIRENVINLLQSDKKQEAILITKTIGADHVKKLEKKMLELAAYARIKADNFIELAERKQSHLEIIIMISAFSGVLISLFIAFTAMTFVIKSQKILQEKNDNLQKALDEIDILEGILPICCYCKNIKNDEGDYEKIESYIHNHSDVKFTHTICPSCLKKHYPNDYEDILARVAENEK